MKRCGVTKCLFTFHSLQCDLESQAYGELGQMLRAMENGNSSSSTSSSSNSSGNGSSTPTKPSAEVERINELLKVSSRGVSD